MGWSLVTEHSSCCSLGWIWPIPRRAPTESSPKFTFFLFKATMGSRHQPTSQHYWQCLKWATLWTFVFKISPIHIKIYKLINKL